MHERLESATLGRVGVSIGVLPVIGPVNFAVVGDIVSRTSAGTELDAAAVNLVVGFEVDGFDPVGHRGWSVVVQGAGAEVTDPRVPAAAPPGPSRRRDRRRGAFRSHRSDIVSGRRLDAGGAGNVSR